LRTWLQNISPYLFNQVDWASVQKGTAVELPADPYVLKIDPIVKKKPASTPATPSKTEEKTKAE
jgi:hypothetical protein